jgi:predicted RNA-binding Zn ribbon-like protein
MKGLVDVIDFQDEHDVVYAYNDLIYRSRYLAEERFYEDGGEMTEKEKLVFFIATLPEQYARDRKEMYINVGWGSEYHFNQRYLFDLCSQAAQIDAGEDFSPIRMCPDCADTFDPETGQKHSHLRVVEGGKK